MTKFEISEETKQNLVIAECYGIYCRNARSRGIVFNISLMTYANIKKQETCAYSGLPFDGKNKMSLERLDNSLGYIDGNVVPVILRLNCLRGNLTLDDIDTKILSLEETKQFLFYEIKRIDESLAKTKNDLEEWESLPKTETKIVEKYVLTHNQIYSYVNTANCLRNIKNRIKHYNALTKERTALVNATGHKKISDKRKEHCLQELAAYAKKQILHDKQLKDAETMMKSIIPNLRTRACEVTIDMDPSQGFKMKQRIKSLKKNLLDAQKKLCTYADNIEDLKLIKNGLLRFANLSNNDKMKLSLGLPLETPTVKALKHKIGLKLLSEKL